MAIGVAKNHHYKRAMTADPPSWLLLETYPTGNQWSAGPQTTVIATVEMHHGKHWLHVSANHGTRVPNYEELAEIKDILFGPKMQAIMVFPHAKHHVNIIPNCLHLFGCATGDGLPEFSKNGII